MSIVTKYLVISVGSVKYPLHNTLTIREIHHLHYLHYTAMSLRLSTVFIIIIYYLLSYRKLLYLV